MHSIGELELLVMLAALRLGPEHAYTVTIADEIRRRTGRVVSRASVYTALHRLEEKELVETVLGDPRSERGGRPPRLVSVSPAGLAAVRSAAHAVQTMAAGLTQLRPEFR